MPQGSGAAANGMGGALLSSLARMRGAISRPRIESVVSQVASLFGLVFGLQSIPVILEANVYLKPAWALAMPIVLLTSILAVVITSILRRGVRVAAGIMATAFVISLVLWPAAVLYPDAAAGMQPWLWYFCIVGMACATISFNVWLASFYIAAVPAIYGIVRTLPSGGGVSPVLAMLDALYIFILGAFSLILLTTLRQAADRVDRAQQSAMLRYSVAVKQDAMEAERVHVDALVHDRVLTTLLSASKGVSAMERDLVSAMAADALTALEAADVEITPAPEIELSDLAERLAHAASVLSPGFAYAQEAIPDQMVPGDVAEAVFSAAVQAMVNSLQHAAAEDEDEPERTVSVHPHPGHGFTVQVSDTGVGFDPRAVPQERLGLRVSIRERVARVGGIVHVRALPGSGASIVIVWPEPLRTSATSQLRRVLSTDATG